MGFRATAVKDDGLWTAEVGTLWRVDGTYQGVVDWVMDQYRLAQKVGA